MFSVMITIILILAVIGSIAAWINTNIILTELQRIKKHLGIEEEKLKSFINDEFDKD